MQATSTDTLFQSDAEIERSAARQEKAARTANAGSPIKLPSKPLDLIVQPGGSNAAWTAESGFVARKVDLKTGKTLQTYKGHKGPVTSLAFYRPPGAPCDILITGSWDKSIRLWTTQPQKQLTIIHDAHTDFVKTLKVLPQLKVLFSGGSDKDLRAWDLSSLDSQEWSTVLQDGPTASTSSSVLDSVTTKVKETLNIAQESSTSADSSLESATSLPPLSLLTSRKGQHTRPIETLAWFPVLAKDGDDTETGKYTLWSADSMGRICIWQVSRDAGSKLQLDLKHTWLAHETAISEIHLSEGEAWTVSSDHLATLWTFDATNPASPPVPTVKLPHPYFVKSLLPLEQVLPGSNTHYVLTGSTDEQIRIWDLSQLDSGSGEVAGWNTPKKPLATAATASEMYKDGKRPEGLVYELEGHFHEVNKLAIWSTQAEESLDVEAQDELSRPKAQRQETYIVSSSLDCTIRKWRLRDVLELAKAAARLDKDERTHKEKKTAERIKRGKTKAPVQAKMTEEEERELAELMDD